ncbi:VOC family protein [Hankyongella ginsenosidimutans]|uniref:VOC family protein n=1 Tax=Hankyongella ginsenosidimutans TaxID=1763828 RepID=A0A4D7C6M3_9SPHN|nr:VOC family protein [Hankyongella ginsenosidimutans]QCI79520.1 VOC family protein [Hankyongella ginsenosidimutans]
MTEQQTVTAYLTVKDALGAIDFCTRVFGAVVTTEPLMMSDGTVGHAALKVGNTQIMLADEFPQMGFVSPEALGGTPVAFIVRVEDCDAAYDMAMREGAMSLSPPENQFWGDRMARIMCPYGYRWNLAAKVEDVSDAEMRDRLVAMQAYTPASEDS